MKDRLEGYRVVGCRLQRYGAVRDGYRGKVLRAAGLQDGAVRLQVCGMQTAGTRDRSMLGVGLWD